MITTPPDSPERVLRALRSNGSFLVTSHVSPDGDAIGSMLAMAQLLRGLGVKSVTCALADPVPEVYRWLEGAAEVLCPEDVLPAETAIILDAHKRDRTGAVAPLIERAATEIVIDHHEVDTSDADVQFINASYAATGEMVAELFERGGVALTRAAAECIYVAISTDTGNFRYANTTARSHRLAARLIEAGINVREITARVIDTMSRGKFLLLRRLLDRIEFDKDGRIAYADIYAADMEETGAKNEDVDGLINYLRNLEGVQLAILFREVDGQKTKVSLRSQSTINSAELLRHFGGGGHAAAAGATLNCPLGEARARFFNHLRGQPGIRL
jgi:phosphoesterase RecJ-like protein